MTPDSEAPGVAVVTGAAGWLGQNLVRALAGDRAQRVRCLVHDAEQAPLLEVVDPRIEAVVGDVRDPAVDRPAVRRHRAGDRLPRGRR